MSSDSQHTCQVCGKPLESNIVYCGECHTPHHRDCWLFNGQCSTYACNSSNFTESAPARLNVTSDPIDENTPVPQITPPKTDTFKKHEETPPSIHFDKTAIVPDSNRMKHLEGKMASGAVPLNRAFRFETFIEVLQFLTAILAIASVNLAGFSTLILVSLSLFLGILRGYTDCTWILDPDNSAVLYSRKIFGFQQTWKICDFSEIESVGVRNTKAVKRADLQPSFSKATFMEKIEALPDRYIVYFTAQRNTPFVVSFPVPDLADAAALAGICARITKAKLLPKIDKEIIDQSNSLTMSPFKGPDYRHWNQQELSSERIIAFAIAIAVLIFRG